LQDSIFKIKSIKAFLVITLIEILFLPEILFSAPNLVSDTNKTKTILERQKVLNVREFVSFSPEQDSAYFKALRIRLPLETRLARDLAFSAELWQYEQNWAKGDPLQIAFKNLQDIPYELYKPSPIEIVQYQTNLINSQYIPGIRTLMLNSSLVTLGDVASFLGLTEDVSPVIRYNIENISDVEIVVYSIQAVVIASLFEGPQPPGSYKLTWNCRDDKGRKMPSGDYIAEVRIGKNKYVRKRIVIP